MKFRLFGAWMLAIPINYFAVGLPGNFYSSSFEIVLLSFVIQLIAGLFIYYFLGRLRQIFQNRRADFLLADALFTTLLIFILAMFGMAKGFPSLFDPSYVLLEGNQQLFFAIGCLIALPLSAWILSPAKKFKQTRLFEFIEENLPGLTLSAFFFPVYFIFASIFNRPIFDVDDIFFDSDGLLWRLRFTTDQWVDYYHRSVHPFVLILVRPLVTFISLFLKGDKLSAAFILVALMGALCIFLAWYFVKKTSGNSVYALLIASMLGASAAHLVFASLIETYIFLAAVQIFFFVLLLNKNLSDNQSLFASVLVGLAAFGITITNFAQIVIGFIVVKRDFKRWVIFGILVVLLTFPLTLLNNFIYKDANPYFFDLASFNAETENTFKTTLDRALAVGRVMILHSTVAPDPLILKEEIPFLKVWIFKADPMRLGEYRSLLGRGLVVYWILLALLGGVLFLKNLKKEDNRFPFAFILVILFNFALHLKYGKDIFLYSANWTYAIILFLALAWKEFSNRKWFQIVLLIFLLLELINNSHLIQTMLSTSALHIK